MPDSDHDPPPATARPARQPTTSAAQAFLDTASAASTPISFGLPLLDSALQDSSGTPLNGLEPRRVTEIYGPPGVGKTTFCMQAAAGVLVAGGSVVWIDGGARFATPRLRALVDAVRARRLRNATPDPDADADTGAEANAEAPEHKQEQSPQHKQPPEQKQEQPPEQAPTPAQGEETSTTAALSRLTHYQTPSLAHLLALLHAPSFPATGTRLMILDGLSSLLDSSYPRSTTTTTHAPPTPTPRNSAVAPRKQAATAHLATHLSRLSTAGPAILLTSPVATTISRTAGPARLRPSLSSSAWDSAAGTRIALFRDWAPDGHGARFARVVRAGAAAAPFAIAQSGVEAVVVEARGGARKRAFAALDEQDEKEDEDDDDDEYGWAGIGAEAELAAEGLVDDAALLLRHGRA